jgi:hypothetical protein
VNQRPVCRKYGRVVSRSSLESPPLPPTDEGIDARVRAAAFAYLGEQRLLHGDVIPRDALARGFSFEGMRVPLLGPQGIFKPSILRDAPLSITTAPPVEGKPAPYEDEVGVVQNRTGAALRHFQNVEVGLLDRASSAWSPPVPIHRLTSRRIWCTCLG